MFRGYIILLRDGYDLLEDDPDAYLLLSQIALRARRFDDQFGLMPLKANQALIGDYEKLKLSRDRYRRAKIRLEKYGIVTFQSCNKGTIATLISTTVFDINADNSASTSSSKPPSTLSMKTLRVAPSNRQQETNKSPPNNYQKAIKQPLTRMKERNKETTTTPGAAASPYECLLPIDGLSQEEKLGLAVYPQDRVKMALEYAKSEPIKKNLISAIHWHCKQPIPPKSVSKGSEQRGVAFQFNEFLKEHGHNELYDLNLSAINQDVCHILSGGRNTTITLKNSTEQVKKDLEESKREILKSSSDRLAL